MILSIKDSVLFISMQKSINKRYSSQQKIKFQGEVILANPSLVFQHKHLSLSKQNKDK
jgi:hypothetical protein